MKIATSFASSVTKLYGLEKGYQLLAEAGFQGIDLSEPMNLYRPFEGLFAGSEGEFLSYFAKERAAMEAAGLTCCQLHVPFPTYPDRREGVNWEEEFKFMVGAIKKCFRAAKEVGAPYAVLHPLMRCGWGKDDNPRLTFCMNEVLLADLIEEAEKQGVKIALENMPNAWIPTATPESLIEMIDGLNSEYLVACLDTGHANISGITPADFARALGDRLKVLHVHDNDGVRDLHALPFTGVTDWKAFMNALTEINYQGVLSLEAVLDEKALLDSPLEYLKQVKATAQKIIDLQ